MTGPQSYWQGSEHPPYPASSASATPQGGYVESYPAYVSTPSLPEYQQTSPQIRFANSSFHPSAHYSSHPSSRHSVSSSEAEEQSSGRVRAPVHAAYVTHGQEAAGGAMSPSPLYHQPPGTGVQQQQFAPPDEYPAHYSALTTRATSRTDRLPQSMFARAPPHRPADDGSYPSARTHVPAGIVGSSEGWDEGGPLELPPPPKIASSSSAPSRKKGSSQAPRKRVPASCTPCRKKKLRCNRSMPCSSCVERGDPDGCVWDGDAVPLFVAREETDVQELKAQVDRLQHLLDALSESTPPVPFAEPVGQIVDAAGSSQLPHGLREREPPAIESATFNLHAQDLCTALCELALQGVLPAQQVGGEAFAPGGVSGAAFLAEAERFLSLASDSGFAVLTPTSAAPSPPCGPQAASTATPSAPSLASAMLGARPSMGQVLPLLPSDDELRATYKVFESTAHWHSSPVNLSHFEQRWPAFREAMSQLDEAHRERDVDPLFCAVLLATCASGLSSMTAKQALARGFPENRSPVVERWIQAAKLSLVAGRFMEEPTLDGIRAASIIASLYLDESRSSGETLSAGLSLLSLAVHGAFALGLHRDPSRASKGQLTFAECEERRRLFWSVFSLCMSTTTGTSRPWTQFDLRQIDCKFPLDCYDAELAMDERASKARVRGRRAAESFEETPMTAPLFRAQHSLLVKKITDKAFGVAPCTYLDVLALDADLTAFEKSLPPQYELLVDGRNRVQFASPPSLTEMRAALVHFSLSAEFVRLHRPFLVLAATDDRYQHSREQCVKYAKRLLAINATVQCSLDSTGHNFKVLSAAIVLSLELLQSPAEPDVPIIRNAVDQALKQAEGFAGISSVCRKGSGVVRFVLSKVDNDAANTSAPRRAKRARTLRYSPEENKPSRLSLARALGGAPTAASSRGSSPDDDPRRRKPTRPPLPHVASDTVVPRVTATPTVSKAQAPALRLSRSRSADQAFPTIGSIDSVVAAGPHSAEATYAPGYTVAPPARQIVGLGGASARRARELPGGASATLAAHATFSPPASALQLQLPSSQYGDVLNGPSTASTTGGFDFGELSLGGGGGGSRSGDSILDDGDMQDVFGLSPAAFTRSPLQPGNERLSDEMDRVAVAGERSGGSSKSNEPLAEEDFAYLNQYQH